MKIKSFGCSRGFLEKDTYYQPQKAVYGLRRSPWLWGEHRDKMMQTFVIGLEEEKKERMMKLVPLDSEPNLWRIVDQEDEEEQKVSS